ncbi:hypothetical protein Pmar_PMAR017085 [Perkinsus marinus ATCC 50983]|uniref:Uncharacterized protein n=1 Tax=Perkinsus marinus (strain ATCC 50983 / TXsc) TaxID=423536 RepID=C5LSI6_PERM5|nr:hypothetical protein Pmar_PMAR017085 [Perkinsus marinus ATCC 50983]EER00227.1 hypothetical protein Pmar_PMAR017085 [Perkinsus marinus ATCC 50983]|eukprot:XP_002767509.1 hypothetical protein Pmar_PMAR017085 [Perkinsus marinus ATCC 50983]
MSASSTGNFHKKDLAIVEETAKADAEEAQMGAEAAALHTRLALEHAKDYNDLCDLLSVRAEAGSAAATMAIGNGSRKEEVRISLQMPERYNGTTDFSAWLRRYENTANAAGWSSGTKAARLGMYLTDEYYEMWDQYAPKVTFEEDSRIMSQMLARRPADALLDNFHDLRWAPDMAASTGCGAGATGGNEEYFFAGGLRGGDRCTGEIGREIESLRTYDSKQTVRR